jgi:hypothetical protein
MGGCSSEGEAVELRGFLSLNFAYSAVDEKPEMLFMCLKILVGERGFEPPTPWSRTRCSTRLSHSPTTADADHDRNAAISDSGIITFALGGFLPSRR